MRRGLLLLAALALVLVPALPAQAAKRRAPKGFYGVMWNRAATDAPAALHPDQFATMARSGVESIRTVFSWARAQPYAGTTTSFGETDRVVGLAAARHIDLLPVVIYTPLWARAYPDRFGSPPARASDYAAYLTALVGRYGPTGSFWAEHPELPRIPIRNWQIWNEPSLDNYWYVEKGKPWAPGYTALLKTAKQAIKAADRHATVVTAGLAIYPWTYLNLIYKAGGRNAFDAVAINLFTSKPSNVIRGVRWTRRVLRKRHQLRKKVWVTETTWPASKGRALSRERESWEYRWETSPAGMSKRLGGLYRVAVKGRRRYNIGRVYWYTWATSYRGDDLFDYDGLLHWDGSAFQPQPALKGYRLSAQRFQGCTKTSAGVCKKG